jgi:hypothetical protein
MTTLDAQSLAEITTNSGATAGTEIRTNVAARGEKIATTTRCASISVPSGVPEAVEAENHRYVFRINGTHPGEMVIEIDTRQLVEQAKVRKTNRAIARARES